MFRASMYSCIFKSATENSFKSFTRELYFHLVLLLLAPEPSSDF